MTAVSTEEVLIVAGGRGDSGPLETVEVLNLGTKQWSFAANLPKAVYRASGCICGDYLYVLGGERDIYSPVKYVFRASISDFCKGGNELIFCCVADLPLDNAACVSVRGEVLVIGGLVSAFETSKLVYRYDSLNGWQELNSSLTTPRSRSYAVALSQSKLIVVGGYTIEADVGCTDSIEFADLVNV